MSVIPLNYRSFTPWNSLYESPLTYNPNDNFIVADIKLRSTIGNFMVLPIYNIIVEHNINQFSAEIESIPIWSLKYDGIILIGNRRILLHMDNEVSDILLNQLHNNNFKEIQIDE